VHFPVSDVTVSPLVPVLVGFVVAFFTTPAGISGAFLLLPFQVSALKFTTPGVTPTNLLFNVISTPGGIGRFKREGSIDREIVTSIAAGAVPGVVIGSILRVTVFSDPGNFKIAAGFVLFAIGANLVFENLGTTREARERHDVPRKAVTAVAAGAGIIGGVYGISGGSMIAPILVGVMKLPVRRVASAALTATLITSIAGVASFELLDLLGSASDAPARPDWLLASLFGVGGAAGGYLGARYSSRMPEKHLRVLLGALATTLGVIYVSALF
jgi:uncharacterized membrane protein YfcA